MGSSEGGRAGCGGVTIHDASGGVNASSVLDGAR